MSQSNLLTPSPIIKLSASAQRAMQTMLAYSFHAPWWMKNRHIMTLGGHFIKREFPGVEEISKERIFQVARDAQMLTHCGWQANKHAPTVIVVHGLEGSSGSKYAVGTALKAYQAGFNVIRINQRGCNNTFHLSASPYHAGLTNDLRCIVDELVLNDGISEIYIVGFSLGGNQSLKLAGEYGDNPPPAVCGVCAVSVPIDLGIVADALHWAENLHYEWSFLMSLHNSYQQRKKLHPDLYNLPTKLQAWSMRKFDDLVVAPHNGFKDANDYYQQCSSGQFLSRINIPTLIIQAKDDPFIPFAPFEKLAMSNAVALLATDDGGHVGYVGEKNANANEDRFWVENRAIEFFRLLRAK